jgi:hypothetical protein
LPEEKEKSNFPLSAGPSEAEKLVSMEKRSAQILVLFLLASLWFQSWPVSLGLILGGGVALLNFRWLRRIMEKFLLEKKKHSLLQFVLKFLFLLLVIFLLFRYGQVNPVAFILGVSTLVMGILFEVLRESLGAYKKGAY